MKNTLGWIGSIAGALGVALCAVSGLARVSGQYHLAGFEAMTLFNGGIALMVAGCLFKLHALQR